MSPNLRSVVEAGFRGIERKNAPNEIKAEHFFDTATHVRQAFSELVRVGNAERIAIIPSVSYGVASVAQNAPMGTGRKIIIADEQFPSNFYTWARHAELKGGRVEAITAPAELEHRGKRWNERIIDAIDADTAVVSIGHVHWADGTCFDLQSIRQRSADVGAWLVIDGTQSVGAMPFDVGEIRPDALICAAYKWLLGPYSIGLAYYGEVLDDGRPIEESWITRQRSDDFAGLVQYEHRFRPGARRYDMGECSNFILLPMLLESLRQLVAWQPARIQTYCASIAQRAVARLCEAGCYIEGAMYRGSHLFGVHLPNGVDAQSVKQALDLAGISVSRRGRIIRTSPNVYNTTEEMDRFATTMIQALHA